MICLTRLNFTIVNRKHKWQMIILSLWRMALKCVPVVLWACNFFTCLLNLNFQVVESSHCWNWNSSCRGFGGGSRGMNGNGSGSSFLALLDSSVSLEFLILSFTINWWAFLDSSLYFSIPISLSSASLYSVSDPFLLFSGASSKTFRHF